MTEYEDIRTGRHCVLALHAHLVFVTKFRHPVFTGTHLERAGSVGGAPLSVLRQYIEQQNRPV
ncbi:hypothetical protein FHX41_4660 [Actinomadura hallensis]|uniref:Transposase IS200 family protein n=1 Tax=Actinomadura hallensis TaxID=337895 RepID=A0A543IJZ8_9ACTN|nr:hypothetical protein [Actinomadura hallensis]TQM70912.1 hypothetical protein FHX41_4660 [Actinomadura hallensis]